MNYSDIIREIKNNKIKQVYLLYGEEAYLMRKLEKTIIDAVLPPAEQDMNLIIYNQDPEIQELIAAVEAVPFMSGKNVIVIRGTSWFKAKKGNIDDELLSDGKDDKQLIKIFSNIPSHSYIVLSTTEKIDKRRKCFKAIETNGVAVEVASLKFNDVRGWLNTKLMSLNKKMASDALEHLLGALSLMPNISLSFLDNEVEKMALYSSGHVISFKDVENVLSSIPEISIFTMIDAISQRQKAKALTLLNRQFIAGEHPLRILALLVRQIRMLWQVKEMLNQGTDINTMANILKVRQFVVEKLIRQSRNFSWKALKVALLALAQADYDFKAGKADNVIIEKIIIELCS